MPLTLQNLTSIQLDMLKELTNIGGGNAATALSQMINRPVKMEVPMVRILPYEEVFSKIKSEEEQVCAVSLRILGDAPGQFLYVMEEKDALNLVKMMIGENTPDILDGLATSALQEACNILCSSYVNALSRMLNLTLISSVPAFVQDMFGAILTSTYIQAGQIEEDLLIIENYFLENNNKIKAHLFFIPHPGSLEKILSIAEI